jgi:hypothetical protein
MHAYISVFNFKLLTLSHKSNFHSGIEFSFHLGGKDSSLEFRIKRLEAQASRYVSDVSLSGFLNKDREKRGDARSISEMNMVSLLWFTPPRRVIDLRPVLLYYAIKFDTPDRSWDATFIV